MLPATLGGVGWVVPGLVGFVCAGVLWQAARHRTTRVNDVRLERAAGRVLPGGALLGAVAAFTALIGVFGLVVVILVALR